MSRLTRRELLAGAAAGALGAAGLGCRADTPPFVEDGFDTGDVAHLLPTASHERILLKASFRSTPAAAPRLEGLGGSVVGRATGATGRFFQFDVAGLVPDRAYRLRLVDPGGTPLCDPWPLHTLPHPDAAPERLRVLCFTCAGGPELANPLTGEAVFQPLGIRRRLLARALSFAPDLAFAIGDHIYWDLRSSGSQWLADGPWGWWKAGLFDRAAPILGDPNEDVVHAAFGPQIGDLYGTLFRSLPTYFLRDDHDYTENDEPELFPADDFMRRVADATQALYYPELIGSGGARSGSFGSLRYGSLFEALLYDCRGEMSTGPDPETAGFLPPERERWLVERTVRSDARHLAHVPSTPILWSAGKWGEWYPDLRAGAGVLTTDVAKPEWPGGWGAQHDRLLGATAARTDRVPLFISGDLHSTAMGAIHESGGERLPRSVVSVLSGTPGTGGIAWPSRRRGTRARPSTTLRAEEWVEPLEENGFTLLDVEPDRMVLSQFRWSEADGLGAIERLEPFAVKQLGRAGA